MNRETRVDLLRHGAVSGGRRLRGAATDDPLSARGRTDMERVLRRAGPWDVLVSSPMQRCVTVARSAADERGLPLRIEERFTEYDFGSWSGRELDALWTEAGDDLARFLADPEAVTPPGGETARDFRARVRSGWHELLTRDAGRRVLLIAHGGVLRQIVADALGVPFSIHAALEWPNAALSRLRVFDDPDHGRTVALAFHARQFTDGAG